MSSYVDQANARDSFTPPPSYPPTAGKPATYAGTPPLGYPVNDNVDYPQQQAPVKTRKRGDGFWKGCCAAMCCCCLVDMCV